MAIRATNRHDTNRTANGRKKAVNGARNGPRKEGKEHEEEIHGDRRQKRQILQDRILCAGIL